MKVAILLDTTSVIDWYRVYRYDWKFRLPGHKRCWSFISGTTEEEAIEHTKRYINGKITLVRITEI